MLPRFDPDKHHRRSIRLRGYDYAQPGAYFVTICTQGRVCVLGDVVDSAVELNDAGRMVSEWWVELPGKFPSYNVDEHVVMPNHFHGIVINVGADLRTQGGHTGPPLPRVVQWFKTMTTNAYIRGVNDMGWAPFQGKFWQRNYYEHVIRNDDELNVVRQYIRDNPARWPKDVDNPTNIPI